MAQRHADAGRDEARDETRRDHFRRQGHEQRAVARCGQHCEVIRRGLPEAPLVVHARPLAGEIRAFQMQAENARLAAGNGVDRLQCEPHFLRAVADERRQQARGPTFPVRSRDGADALHRRLVVEQDVAAAIHLQVDESRRKPCALG